MRFLFVLFLSVFSFGMDVEDYVKAILNYSFKLDKFEYIKEPFFVPEVKEEIKVVKESKKVEIKNRPKLKNRIKFDLISILGDSAYIEVEEYLGDTLIYKSAKLVSKGDKIVRSCILYKITSTDVYIKCKHKMVHKTLNPKIPVPIRDK